MRKFSTALAAAGLLALAGCGGGSESGAANNTAEDVNVSADGLGATDTLDANALGNDVNALDAGNVGNGADANLTDTGNAAGNEAANTSANSQ